jgi:hypothetical protein
MNIQLTDQDLAQMPPELCSDLMGWLQTKQSRLMEQATTSSSTAVTAEQLNLEVALSVADSKKWRRLSKLPQSVHSIQTQEFSGDSFDSSHIRLSQLFDMGLLTESTQIRIRLKRVNANQLGYSYLATGIQISPRGTVIFDGEEFDKPSPLASKVNGSAANGWAYIEIKRNGQWVCLNELRKIWRNVS